MHETSMESYIALLIGILAAAGTRLLLCGGLFRLVLGVALLAQAANLLVFAAAGLGDGSHPIVPVGADRLPEPHPDPLAQALVLTAIVIGFGAVAFCLGVLAKVRRRSDNPEVDSLTEPDW
jgi:multicomponent Na+:H+ antiporter subunit C